ncbi:MAG: DUF1194 domain-containing protein [Paracraurococcus sp.]
MRRRRILALAGAAAGPAPLAAPLAAQPAEVDTLLVLAMDASGSIDADEFRLQREGYAEALAHPAMVAAIASRPRGAIAVAVVEWGAPGGAATVVGFRRVAGAADAQALARALLAAPRSPQSWNAIGDAIDHCAGLLRSAPFRAAEQVIDLSGDGPDLRSLRPAPAARDAAVEAGIRINALAVAAAGQVTRDGEALAETYRREVIGGPGAFVLSAEGRGDIARALRAKLVREIA